MQSQRRVGALREQMKGGAAVQSCTRRARKRASDTVHLESDAPTGSSGASADETTQRVNCLTVAICRLRVSLCSSHLLDLHSAHADLRDELGEHACSTQREEPIRSVSQPDRSLLTARPWMCGGGGGDSARTWVGLDRAPTVGHGVAWDGGGGGWMSRKRDRKHKEKKKEQKEILSRNLCESLGLVARCCEKVCK